MRRRLFCLICVVLVLGMTEAIQAVEFSDDFNDPYNFLSEGPGKWDGFIGLGVGETVDVLNADINRPGQLYIESTGSNWWPAMGPPLGPFLYKQAGGDFIATVHVTDFAGDYYDPIYFNDCGIMARVANLNEAGSGEDFESIHFFWTMSGNFASDVSNNVFYDWGYNYCPEWPDCNDKPFLQLERKDNFFYFRVSEDGEDWISLDTSGSPFDVNGFCIERPDLDGLPLQVGLWQCTNKGPTGYAAFDDFTLSYTYIPELYAREPYPLNGAINVPVDTNLSWTPGIDANAHDVYLGTDHSEVEDASRTHHPNVEYYNVSDACCAPGELELLQKYYWRVDEVNGLTLWRGNIWNFTTANKKCIETFDDYASHQAIRAVWGPNARLETSDAQQGYSMKVVYDVAIEVARDITDSNWAAGGVEALSIWCKGDADVAALSVTLQSNNGAQSGTLTDADAINENAQPVNVKSGWHQMNFDLDDFGVDLSNVTRLALGVIPETSGSGSVYFDSICLYLPRRIGPKPVGDISGDGDINFKDLAIVAEHWLDTNMFP
ncbi:MAG: hypothetical protein AMJ43_10660 [Coxiella sp. DG_40]|nr:MAG: hypothetical protein AMJ43_10660 [Coxiella sp. DG_40]